MKYTGYQDQVLVWRLAEPPAVSDGEVNFVTQRVLIGTASAVKYRHR